MKRIITVIALAAALTACSEQGEVTEREAEEFTQTTSDGEAVVCLWFKDGYGGGLSCNWEDAR